MRQAGWRRLGAYRARTGRGRGTDGARTERGRNTDETRSRCVCCGGAGDVVHLPGGAANGAAACVQRDEPLASRSFSCEPSPIARL